MSKPIDVQCRKSPIPITQLLSEMQLGEDSIYGYDFTNRDQAIELEMREQVAGVAHDNLLTKIATAHSVPVMDFEVARFLRQIPPGGRVIDVGGCWGWHSLAQDATNPTRCTGVYSRFCEGQSSACQGFAGRSYQSVGIPDSW